MYSLKIPVVTTMHDLQEFHFPEFFSSQERLHRAINNKKSLEESAGVIVSFEHVKKDILKYFQIDENKIFVCPPPFSENWFTKKDHSKYDEVKNKYSLSDEFILYPAASWRHKNHENLIKAINKLKHDGISINLICTGTRTEYYEKVLKILVSEFNLNDEIKFIGIIPECELISLYKMSRLVVIPTMYEAGSGPLYEAMRYRVPVVCSNVTSLPETMNNNEFVFNPFSVEEISAIIRKGITDEDFRKRNVENSIIRMDYYKKLNFDKAFIDLYNLISKDKV